MSIYLDSVSTTRPEEEVKETYKKLLDDYYCNSDALYDDGVAIYDMQEKAREKIAGLLGVGVDEIIFTSGASEANSLAIKGLCLNSSRRHIVTSIYEHSSVYNAIRQLEDNFGFNVTFLNPDSDGHITLDQIKQAIKADTVLVSIMAVNNEIGAVNDVEEIAKYIKKRNGIYFHSDLTQAIGKIDVDLSNIDMASFSAHKIHGLKGSGALIRKKHISLLPLISGGQQEYSIRGGTSNSLVNIVLAKTLRLALDNKDRYHDYLKELHDRLINGLKDIVTINYDKGIDTLVNISTPITSEVLLNALNKKGIMVSSKSTCGSKKNEPNRTLHSMNIDENYAIRISFDYLNTIEEIDYFIDALKEILDKYA